MTIIKPCAMKNGHAGAILTEIQKSGFEFSAIKYMKITKEQAELFYEIHKERPFFNELVQFMISEPVIIAVLKRENAVAEYRKLIGATNPAEAAEGTIRKKYALNILENAVHGSDCNESAVVEANFFFAVCERY